MFCLKVHCSPCHLVVPPQSPSCSGFPMWLSPLQDRVSRLCGTEIHTWCPVADHSSHGPMLPSEAMSCSLFQSSFLKEKFHPLASEKTTVSKYHFLIAPSHLTHLGFLPCNFRPSKSAVLGTYFFCLRLTLPWIASWQSIVHICPGLGA